MAKQSAGILVYRYKKDVLEVFLVHPGGPFYQKKDDGVWSIPKGEYSTEEDPLEAAKREFHEETGMELSGEFYALQPIKQPGRKVVSSWIIEGAIDETSIKSNTFNLEWPPRSGNKQDFPEVDRASWFDVNEAKNKITKGQIGFIEELQEVLNYELELDHASNQESEESRQISLFDAS